VADDLIGRTLVSYYTPVAAPAPRQRPSVVTAASYLLYVVAALVVVSGIATLTTYHAVLNAVQADDATSVDISTLQTAAKVGLILGIILNLIEAGVFVMLGIFVARGNNGMRITTWVIAGLGVLCFGCGAVGSGISSSIANSEQSNGVTAVRIQDAMPGWARGLSVTVSVLCTLLAIAIIVLLTLGPSNAYFRSQQVAYVPAYPGYPGAAGAYPGYPGAAGAYPGYPTAPDGTPGYPQSGYPQSGYPPPTFPPTYPSNEPPVYPPNYPPSEPPTGGPVG